MILLDNKCLDCHPGSNTSCAIENGKGDKFCDAEG